MNNNFKQNLTTFGFALKKELIYLGMVLIVLAIILKIAFYKESLGTIIKTSLSIFWLFIIPGFFILYYWYEKLDFIERLLISFVFSSAIIGITSYYLGIFGLHIKYHNIVIPIILLISALFLLYFKMKKVSH